MSASDCKKTRITKTTTTVLAERSTLEMLDLALLSDPDLPIRDIPEGMLAVQSCVTGGSDPSLSGLYMSRDKCWLCSCPRTSNSHKNYNASEESCKSKVGVLSEFLPWLCPECENTMEEEEKKVELSHLSLPPLPLDISDTEESCNAGIVCHCDACTEIRHAEAEHDKETKELQECWSELSQTIQQVYHMHNADDLTRERLDILKMKQLVLRLSSHDAHQLYQRLESPCREFVIEMKVKLLKVLTLDYKTAAGAYQFVSMLLEEYAKLCRACQTVAGFLQPLVEHHLGQFCLTWQLHNKHLFHSIIFTDPVVQNCLPKAVENLRLGLSKSPDDHQVPYSKTLADYERFVNEMSVICTTWKQSQRLIEKYDEKQAALKVKQKMFKEDWEFFKAQRRLLEQMVPKSKSSSLSCHRFEMQFQQMQKILQGNQNREYYCPNCRQVRCSLDENSISHLITCGIISPEVVEESSNMEPLSHQFQSDLPTYLNVKPPSMPSSGSSSGSGSPMILERERFIVPYDSFCVSDDDGMTEEPVSDDDDDFHDAEPAPPECGNGPTPEKSNGTATEPTSDIYSLAANGDDVEGFDKLEFKETQPSSSVAKMTLTQVRPGGENCNCHHCQLQNGTPCMFSRVRPHDPDAKQHRGRLFPNPFLNPELYGIPMRVEDDEEKDRKGKRHDKKDPEKSTLAEVIQNVSQNACSHANAAVSSNEEIVDILSCLDLPNCLSQNSGQMPSICLNNKVDLASSFSQFFSEPSQMHRGSSKGQLHPEKWKMDTFTDQWNSSQQKKNVLLRMSMDGVLEEPSSAVSQRKKMVAAAGAVSSSSCSGAKCSASQPVSLSGRAHGTSSQISPCSKPPSGQPPNHSAACQAAAHMRTTVGASSRLNSAIDAVKCAGGKPPSQKPVIPSTGSGTQCKASSTGGVGQTGGCLVHGCEQQCTTEEAPDGKAESSDRGTSQKEGKQCECFHCNFFGHETPSLPLNKNYTEIRDRLRLRLKQKKERMNQSLNSNSPQKQGGGGGGLPAVLDEVAVEEILRYINGRENEEEGKGSRSSSQAAAKKSKKQKKSKENVRDFDPLSNLRSSSETSSSLGSLADSSCSGGRGDQMSGSGHDQLTTSLDSVQAKAHVYPTQPEEASKLATSEKSVSSPSTKKNVRARSAALERHMKSVNDRSPSETMMNHASSAGSACMACGDREVLKMTQIPALTQFKTACAAEIGLNSSKNPSALYQKDQKYGNPSNGMEQNGNQEDAKKKLQAKNFPMSVVASDVQKVPSDHQAQKPSLIQLASPSAKRKKQKRRIRSDGYNDVDDVFLPRQSHEGGEDFDPVVENFKHFVFCTPPPEKREPLRVTLNVKDIFSRRK